MRTVRTWVLLLCAACSATPSTGPDSPPDTTQDSATGDTGTAAPSCELGTGETAWEPLPDALPVIRGPQNGWHVLGAIRCEGLDPGESTTVVGPDVPVVSFTLTDDDGLFGGYEQLPRPMGGSEQAMLINEFVIVWTATYEEAIDREGVLGVVVEDHEGRRAEVSRSVRLVAP